MSPTPRVVEAGAATLRRLSAPDGEGKVLSVYVNLDPSEFATAPARETQITSVLGEAMEQIERLEDDSRKVLRQTVDEIRDYLRDHADWALDARGVAVFRSASGELFDVVKLPEPVASGAYVEDSPYVRPLAEIATRTTWCVALVNRRGARLFLGGPSRLVEVEDVEDEVHGAHQQGGWSQARYQRGIEEQVANHLDHTCERILELHRSQGFDRLVIGATEELWPRVVAALRPAIGDTICSRIDVDTQKDVGVHELEAALEHVVAADQAASEERLLDRFRQEHERGGRAAGDLEPVLRVLNEARIETLLVASRFEATGARCPACGWLGTDADECPVDGTATTRPVDLVEKALERCDELSADSWFVQREGALADVGGIGALLRF